jgi:hypothetical protein
MKANELRIGNYVNYIIEDDLDERKEWLEISQIDAEDLMSLDDNYSPIPLTEEWVESLGFEYNEYYTNYHLNNTSVQFRDGRWLFSNDQSDAGCFVLREIKYVNQLQNIYFALTDTELVKFK